MTSRPLNCSLSGVSIVFTGTYKYRTTLISRNLIVPQEPSEPPRNFPGPQETSRPSGTYWTPRNFPDLHEPFGTPRNSPPPSQELHRLSETFGTLWSCYTCEGAGYGRDEVPLVRLDGHSTFRVKHPLHNALHLWHKEEQ